MFDRLLPFKWRIILSGTLISAAPILCLALFVYMTVMHELERLSSKQQHGNAFIVASILEEKLKNSISQENAFVTRTAIIDGITKGYVQEIQSNLHSLFEKLPDTERVFITSPKGILIADYPPDPDAAGKDFSQRDWYHEVSRGWAPYISGAFLSDFAPRRTVFAIAAPIRTATGVLIGILVIHPTADYVKNAFALVNYAIGESILVDNKGMVIYHPKHGQDKIISASDSPVVKKVLQKLDGYENGMDALTGEPVINAYSPVKISGWGVITESYLSEVNAPVKSITWAIYLLTAFMLLISAWFAYKRSILIDSIKTASDNQLREATVEKAYGDILTVINHDWFSVGDLTQQVLAKLDGHLSMVTGVVYLLQNKGLVPVSSLGCALPTAAGKTVIKAMEQNEIALHRAAPGDLPLGIAPGVGISESCEIISVPLSAKYGVVAMLELTSRHGFSEIEMQIISRIASPLGIGINAIRSGLAQTEHSHHLESANQELQRLQKATAESNRLLEQALRTKSDFLANMSHELRTPLNSVIGFSAVLQDQLCGSISQIQQEYVNNIHVSGKKLLIMINDMLDLARVESCIMELELSKFSLREALEASVLLLRENAQKSSIDLCIDLVPEDDARIVADLKKLKQIVFNLASNAVKFTPAGGSVVVSVARDSDMFTFAVTDTGIGISEDNIPKLFQAFTQLEAVYTKEYQGTGLGLALTRQLVELHGGRIWVESHVGTGSRFSFTIPISQTSMHLNRGIV
jgi:signal transduction histidine kinase